jgi:hypothetical protein
MRRNGNGIPANDQHRILNVEPDPKGLMKQPWKVTLNSKDAAPDGLLPP